MRTVFSGCAFCLAAFLLTGAARGATVISFTSTSTGGDISTALPLGPNDTITGFTNIPFDTLTVTGAPEDNGVYKPVFLQESLNTTTDVLTLSGTINGCTNCGNLPGLTTTSALVSIQISALTANTTLGSPPGDNFNVNFPTVTSITVSPVLLADLGLTGATFSLTGFTDSGQSQGSGGNSYTSSSASLVLSNIAVPEPGSWFFAVLGIGTILSLRRFRTALS